MFLFTFRTFLQRLRGWCQGAYELKVDTVSLHSAPMLDVEGQNCTAALECGLSENPRHSSAGDVVAPPCGEPLAADDDARLAQNSTDYGSYNIATKEIADLFGRACMDTKSLVGLMSTDAYNQKCSKVV